MEHYYDASAYAGEPVCVGTKRSHEPSQGKLDAAVMEKRYRREDDIDDEKDDHRWKRIAVYAPSAGTKRGYEQSQQEIEAEEVDKRYKGNCWEDPAYVRLLQHFGGGSRAKFAAQINQSYRLIKEIDARIASVTAPKT